MNSELDIYRRALEAIAEQRVLVMDDQGETLADALTKVAQQALADVGLDFQRAKTASLAKAHADHSIQADRILAGTWNKSELDPATREYIERIRYLDTRQWIRPDDPLSEIPDRLKPIQ
jgi:hypothetical protein